MKAFILSLLTKDTKLSSKRFILLAAFMLLAGVIIASLCGLKIADINYYTLSGIIIGSSAMTLTTSKNTTETVDNNARPAVGFKTNP